MDISYKPSIKLDELTLNIDDNIETEINNLIKNNNITKKILIFSGGGTKGVTYFGALKAFHELNILQNIEIFATTSVGAMVLSLYLVGYTIQELEEFYELFDFTNLTSITDTYKLNNITDLIEKLGLDDGKNIIKVLNKLYSAKKINKDITLLELYKLTKKKFIVTGSCLESNSVEYISYETYPNMKLTEAVRITTSVPFYYQPYKYNNKTFVDGGCMDNYPITLFKDRIQDVIGIYLHSNYKDTKINNIKDYFLRIINILNKGIITNIIRGWEDVTINIYITQELLNFNISLEEKKELFNIGYNSVKEFFNKQI